MKFTFSITLICLLIHGCNNESKQVNIPISEKKQNVSLIKDSIFCDSCTFLFALPEYRTITSKEIISTPIAIEFFHLMDMIGKYDGRKNCVDSLPKKLRNTGRQEIYKTMDQYWIYKYFLKPELNSLKIKTIKCDYKSKFITFEVNGKSTSFNLDYFKENDGLLLYTPNKKPIIWNTESNNKNCDEKTFIKCYFTN